MQDEPRATLILAEVAAALKAGIPAGFQQHVAGNAIALALREDERAASAHASECARLAAILGRQGEIETLNAALVTGIRDGSLDSCAPAIAAHLIQTTIEKMLVDQPGYPAFRAWRSARTSG
jgi:hypothetical protein